jgi:hypothetical protein
MENDGTSELLVVTPQGLEIFRLDTTSVDIAYDNALIPDKPSLSAYPNPFNSRVTISLAGFEGPAEIAIYDIAGRLVCRLDAETGQAIWDGRVEGGAEAQSGLYLVRAGDAKRTATVKIIMLK